MNQVYKVYFLSRLREQLENGILSLPVDFLMDGDYYYWKEILYRKAWVVYAKPPFGGPAHVAMYLTRYNHHIAISNPRIVDITETHVSFRYK